MHAALDPTSTDGAEDDLGALLLRCGTGDEAAFRCLYDAVAHRAYGLSLRILRDRADAEDATHEAFIDLWRRANRYDPSRGSGCSWILTIVHRKAVDRCRSRAASSRCDARYFQDHRDVVPDETSERALTSLDAQRVRSALDRLPRAQVEALELAYFQGLTRTEIAAVLGVPVGTVKTRIRDGLLRLRDDWATAV